MKLKFELRASSSGELSLAVYGGVCRATPHRIGRRNLLGHAREECPGGDWHTDRRLSREVGVTLSAESEEAMRAELGRHFAG